MTDINELPELVRHLRLEATFQQGRTTHKLLRTRRGSPRHEKWTREKKIGHGGFGEVWLERKESYAQDPRAQRGPELRAVKCIHASLKQRDYARELEALATFSSNKDKVRRLCMGLHDTSALADLLGKPVSRLLRPILRLVPKRGMAPCYHGIL